MSAIGTLILMASMFLIKLPKSEGNGKSDYGSNRAVDDKNFLIYYCIIAIIYIRMYIIIYSKIDFM
jgi:hypothetical protein